MTTLSEQFLDIIKKGDIAIDELKTLLDTKVDVNVQDKNGNTPLIYCIATQGSFHRSPRKLLTLKLAQLLIDYGANVNIQDEDKFTPLIQCCEYHTFDIMKLLIQHNADPTLADSGGKNALDHNKGVKEMYEMQQQIKRLTLQ